MGKSYYELFELPPTASLEDIKRAFRREIAKYHPDKVQHLGKEFQDIAAVKAAELTQAYNTLTDEQLRAEYDESLRAGEVPAAPLAPAAGVTRPTDAPPPRRSPAVEEPPRPVPGPGGATLSQDRAASSDLIQKATVMRFRQVVQAEFGTYEAPRVQGFEVAAVPKPPFWKLKLPPRVLGRFVPQVDAAAVSESWSLAARMPKDGQRDLCVFVMGPTVAPAAELATAIAEQRRKPMPAGGKLILIPVNTRNWNAHVPTDAPPVVKALLARLKSL